MNILTRICKSINFSVIEKQSVMVIKCYFLRDKNISIIKLRNRKYNKDFDKYEYRGPFLIHYSIVSLAILQSKLLKTKFKLTCFFHFGMTYLAGNTAGVTQQITTIKIRFLIFDTLS